MEVTVESLTVERVSEALDFLSENSEELPILLNMDFTGGVSEALDFPRENSEELPIFLNDTNSPLPSSVYGVVPLKIKETRTTGSDLKSKRTRVNDEPNGSTSQYPLRRSNYGRTAPPKSKFTFPAAAHGITNHHVASSSGPCNPNRQYGLEEHQNLILAVAIHGRKWQKIKEMLEGTGRKDDNWKQKWKAMMQKAQNDMDENQKWLHIVAAVVQFKDEKPSKFKQEFQTWFDAMGEEDSEKKKWAEKWLDNLKQKS